MKNVFSTVYSTLSPQQLALYVTQEYGLTNVTCNFLVRGVGDTYTVNCNEANYILRIYRADQRSRAQIQAEVELLMHLHNNNVSVSHPVADSSGNYIQALPAAEGTRHAILLTYAAGQSAYLLTENQLVSLGTEMAKFHNLSSTIKLAHERWNYDFNTTLTGPINAVKPFFVQDEENYNWLLGAAAEAQQQVARLNPATFATGYIHFDFLPKNFHFDGDKITLFDFDFFGHGWLVNDIMTFWQHLCMDVFFGRMQQPEADAYFATFIKAYRQLRPLPATELAAIPWLSLGFWVFYLGFYTTHDQFYPLLQPVALKARIDLIRKLMTRYWTETETWKLSAL